MRHGGRVQEDLVDPVDDEVVDGQQSEGYKSVHGLSSFWATSSGFVPGGICR